MKKTNVILTSYSMDSTPTKLKIGKWTEQQKQDFLTYIKKFNPLADDYYYESRCAFNVHTDDYIVHSRGFKKPITFKPMHSTNKPNEMIIEIITDEENRACWPVCPATCPLCMQDGQCTSPFIQKYIGAVLFPNKYAKQK